MTCERASSMPTQDRHKIYTAKTAASLFTLKDIRRWLIDNCKNRWSATDYKGNDFNWRRLGKVKSFDTDDLSTEYTITVMVHFKKPEDLMLYMLSWPSEVLLKS
jgi:hypothetical protein